MRSLKAVMRSAYERADNLFDRFFGGRDNPMHQLGALGWFFYWIVAASGIYLYIFFDTGITQAYFSVDRITNAQWFAGGIMRSLHRYASDALVIVVFLHLGREFAMDRLRGKRWFSWLTGIPLLWFIYACGISGYWLVWDKLAQYVAINTTEWLDALPLFGVPIARNFLSSDMLSDRFFTLMVFIHIAVPLATLLLMWVHIQRHANAKVNPPRALAVGTFAMLVLVSVVRPALSQAPANLDIVVSSVNLDWFYLALYPLMDVLPGGWLWLGLALFTLLLAVLPWAPPLPQQPVAKVDLGNCNGCARCFEDCPYSAIRMEPRSDGMAYSREAVVNADLCVSCGICAGACPTATPFRRATELAPGIQLPDQTVVSLRDATLEAGKRTSGGSRIIVFSCAHGAPVSLTEQDNVATIGLPCIAALPPSFIDFALSRNLADGVMLAGCRDGDCHYRLGLEWSEQRIEGQRDPRLRQRVPRERLAVSRAGLGEASRRTYDLKTLAAQLGGPGQNKSPATDKEDR